MPIERPALPNCFRHSNGPISNLPQDKLNNPKRQKPAQLSAQNYYSGPNGVP